MIIGEFFSPIVHGSKENNEKEAVRTEGGKPNQHD